jgi:hypothetical protein
MGDRRRAAVPHAPGSAQHGLEGMPPGEHDMLRVAPGATDSTATVRRS